MWNFFSVHPSRWLLVLVLATLLLARTYPASAAASPTIELLRRRWAASLTGDTGLDATLPGVREKVEAQAKEARVLWDSMAKTPTDDLWSTLKSSKNSAGITETCARLGLLSKAYATAGSPLYHDPALRADLFDAIRWLVEVRYHSSAVTYDNWWDWQIGVPLHLETCLICLLDELPAATLRAATDAIEAFTPVISATGANGAWRADIILRRAILVEDEAKVKIVRDWMENTLLSYFDPPIYLAVGEGFKEGFYRDGSFFAHNRHPYNGGYGLSALASAVSLVTLLDGTPWAVTEARQDHLYAWIENSFEPLMYQGRFFDNMRGREISRGGATTPWPPPSVALLESLLTAAVAAPPPYQASLRSFVKTMASHVGAAGSSVSTIGRMQSVLNDPTVPTAVPSNLFRHFPLMARTVVLRENFGASVSMHSDSVYDYESLNQENLQGWHTGDGWLQILDADVTQFSDDYWPTVDWHRLPGTTVVRGSSKSANRLNGSDWAGGAEGEGNNGVTGFELRPRSKEGGGGAAVAGGDGETLTARKSWFMFGEAIFCVGSDISADNDAPVETVIENRRLSGDGNNALTVDGRRGSSTMGQQEVTARWLHLAGNVPGSGLGCVFMEPTRVQALRETRTGSWKSINVSKDATPIRRQFLTFWLDHGVRPKEEGYAYILLPGSDADAVSRYASQPDLTLLAASRTVHAVRCRSTETVAANFWEDAPASLPLDGSHALMVDRRVCVLYRRQDGWSEFAVSDPTRANRTAIKLDLNFQLGRVLRADRALHVENSPAGTSLTLDLTEQGPDERGRTYKIRLAD